MGQILEHRLSHLVKSIKHLTILQQYGQKSVKHLAAQCSLAIVITPVGQVSHPDVEAAPAPPPATAAAATVRK